LYLPLPFIRAPTFTEWATHLGTTVLELRTQVRLASQKAKAALVEANLRLVVTVARQTVKKNRSEISFQDACQEGIIGLSRATEKFDPDKGFSVLVVRGMVDS
jgi:DNA-directed RNA polymerase sigma subunit (sigma70/sigma32)